MIELNEDTSPLVQLVGNNINGLEDKLADLEAWACSDDPHMAMAAAYKIREAAEYIMSQCSKRIDL